MPLHLPAKSLLVAALVSSMGCSKKDDPATVASTGTYTLDGVVTPCQVTATTRSGNADYLDIRLAPTDPQHANESVLVYFVKRTGAPASGYELPFVTYSWNGPPVPYGVNYFTPDAKATLSQVSNGGYSGTFSAPFSRFSSKVITAGAFTNVRP